MSGSTFHWGNERDPETGLRILPQRVMDFIEFICDPEKTESVNAYAKRVGIDGRLLRLWKTKPAVREHIEYRLAKLNVNPERVQNVINALYKHACRGDANSAKLYLQYIDRLQPNRVVIEDRRVTEMSDAELKAELEKARIALGSDV